MITVGSTLAEKLWDSHVVRRADGEPDLVYIDLHLVHEVQVDVDQVRLTVGPADHMAVPEFLGEGGTHGDHIRPDLWSHDVRP